MRIQKSDKIPDDTYFTLSDVEPVVNGNILTIYNGKGTRRNWGQPGADSSVVVNTGTFTAVHVGFHHKHRGGQGWFYYVSRERRTWAQLDDKQRKQVLAKLHRAPAWAHTPGKLSSERKKPTIEKRTAYKLVELTDDSRLISLYDGVATEYVIGKTYRQAAKPRHQGGYYSFPTPEHAKALDHRVIMEDGRGEYPTDSPTLALLEVSIGGRIIEYSGSKIASTSLKPIRILEAWIVDDE